MDIANLSAREQRVLTLSMAGLSDKEIAARLGVALATVRTFWKRIRAKFDGSPRAEIIAKAATLLAHNDAPDSVGDNLEVYREFFLRSTSALAIQNADAPALDVCNLQFAQLFGLSRSEALTVPFSGLVDPLMRPLVEDMLDYADKHGYASRTVTCISPKWGPFRAELQVTSTPHFKNGGVRRMLRVSPLG